MIHAYDKTYLDRARTGLGRMLDFAVYDLKYDIDVFFDLFIKSGVATDFEQGDFRLLAGMSGVELAYEVLERADDDFERVAPRYTINRSEEYWGGWALAYYQWETGLTFERITRSVPLKDILAMYWPYHEMDIRQFCDEMDRLYWNQNPKTNLKRLRENAGLSQRQLADLSGVPVRTLQQYEQRQKNINKAQVEYLVMLAKTLCCKVEDLVEAYE